MDDEDLESAEEGTWLVPRRFSPLCLVRAVTILAAGVTTSLQLAFDYLDDSVASHQAYSNDLQDAADSVRLDIDSLPS